MNVLKPVHNKNLSHIHLVLVINTRQSTPLHPPPSLPLWAGCGCCERVPLGWGPALEIQAHCLAAKTEDYFPNLLIPSRNNKRGQNE